MLQCKLKLAEVVGGQTLFQRRPRHPSILRISHFRRLKLLQTIKMSKENPRKREWQKACEYEGEAPARKARGIEATDLLILERQVDENERRLNSQWTSDHLTDIRRLKDQGMLPYILSMIAHVDEESAKLVKDGKAAPALAKTQNEESRQLRQSLETLTKEIETLETEKAAIEAAAEAKKNEYDTERTERLVKHQKEHAADQSLIDHQFKEIKELRKNASEDSISRKRLLTDKKNAEGTASALKATMDRMETDHRKQKRDWQFSLETKTKELDKHKGVVKEASTKLEAEEALTLQQKADLEALRRLNEQVDANARKAQDAFKKELCQQKSLYEGRLTEMENEIRHHKRVIESLRRTEKTRDWEVSVSHTECLEHKIEKRRLEEKEKSLEHTLTKIRSERDEKVRALLKQARITDDQATAMQTLRNEHKRKMDALEKHHAEQKQKEDMSVTKAKAFYDTKAANAKGELEKLEVQLASVKADLEKHQGESIEAARLAAQKLQEMESQRDEERRRVVDLQSSFENLNLQVQKLSRTQQDLDQQAAHTTDTITRLSTNTVEERARGHALEHQLNRITVDLTSLVGALSTAEQRARTFEENLRKMTADRDTEKGSKEQISQKSQGFEDKIDSLQTALETLSGKVTSTNEDLAEEKELLSELYMETPGYPRNLEKWGIRSVVTPIFLRTPRVMVDSERMYVAGYTPPPATFDPAVAPKEWIRCLLSLERDEASDERLRIFLKYWMMIGGLSDMLPHMRGPVLQKVCSFACRLLERLDRMTDIEAWVLFQTHATLSECGANAGSANLSTLIQKIDMGALGPLSKIGLTVWESQRQQKKSLYEDGIGGDSLFQLIPCWRSDTEGSWLVSISVLTEYLLLVAREVHLDGTHPAKCLILYERSSCLTVFPHDGHMCLRLTSAGLGQIGLASCEPVACSKLWEWMAPFVSEEPQDFVGWFHPTKI